MEKIYGILTLGRPATFDRKKKSTFLTYVPVYVNVHKNAVLMAALREVLAPLELELHDTVGC